MCDSGIKNKAVTVDYGSVHPIVDGARGGLPGQSAPVAVQLQSVCKVLCLLTGADEQHDSEELLVTFVLLLLLQHQHEVVTKARLHHHPVNSTWQVNVRGEKNYVFSLKGGDAFVGMHEVGHDGFQGSLPLAGSTRARAGVGPILTDVFVFWLFCVVQCQRAARRGILAGEEHGRGHLLHGQVPDAGGQRAPAGGAEAQLLPALLADQVPGLALQDGRQHIVEAHGALEQRGQLVVLRRHRAARPREDGGGRGHRGGTGAGRGDGGGGVRRRGAARGTEPGPEGSGSRAIRRRTPPRARPGSGPTALPAA